MRHNQTLGTQAENYACRFLEKQHYQILHRNWKTPFGELDIIALDQDEWVCIEVKALTNTDLFDPIDHITPKKTQTLIRLAQSFAANQRKNRNIRIDLALVYCQSHPWRVDHFKDAISQ